MERNPNYKYCIGRFLEKEDEVWIFIKDFNNSGWERELNDWTSDEQYAGPIEFLKRIQEKENWSLQKAGELRYAFKEDENKIIFQFDDLFGFVLIADKNNFGSALKFIKKHIDF